MTRFAGLLLLLLVAGCGGTPPPPPPASADIAPAVCRVGPDGARPVADRGIGGTGAPAVEQADRGIGGTGIIGVITGFASVCLADEEVALPPGLPASVDGQSASADDLRAGQVAALEAAGPPGALQARRIAVQHAVIGRVDAVGRGTLSVAGQFIVVADATGAGTAAQIGDWVAVSGLRQTENTIVATRIDPAPPGRVLVHGELVRSYGALRIGSLRLRVPYGEAPPGGWPAVATGHMDGDVLVADSLTPDLAAQSPSRYFSTDVTNFVVEGYVAVVAGGYVVNRAFVAGGDFADIGTRGRGIATFTRREGADLVATGLRLGDGTAPSGGGFAPAPVPHGGRGDGHAAQPGGIAPRGGERRGGELQGGFGAGPSGFGSGSGFPGPGGFGGDGPGAQGVPGPHR